MTPDLDNEALMLARGQYSTLRREAQQLLDALAQDWQHASVIIRDALAYRHISECRPAERIAEAADRVAYMAERARDIDDICTQLAELRPRAWQGKE
ncbi:MAG: hypothetical protein QG590_808 [Pseudomonadota bacterium]|nr:hypothetical protein [Pseudomonadota bacterium]